MDTIERARCALGLIITGAQSEIFAIHNDRYTPECREAITRLHDELLAELQSWCGQTTYVKVSAGEVLQ